MEITTAAINTQPRDAASVVALRDDAQGLQALLLRRHSQSGVLGGAWVFPGGKVEAGDSVPAALALLDRAPGQIAPLLNEQGLAPEAAAGIFVAAAREAFEETGVLFAQASNGVTAQPVSAGERAEAFVSLLARRALRLDTQSLAPWSRWITPREPTVMSRRFDTRFLLAMLPPEQTVQIDGREITESRWLAPRQALRLYARYEIDLAPPQIMSLLHLSLYPGAAAALADARARSPYRIEARSLEIEGRRTICYPGDPAYQEALRVMPEALPTRLIWRDKRFVPPQGIEAWL